MTNWIKQWTTSATKLVGRAIKNADTFGVRVNLNYKGKEKFSTLVGGLATLLMTGFLLQYFYNQMTNVARIIYSLTPGKGYINPKNLISFFQKYTPYP